jgi:hypothetical protein
MAAKTDSLRFVVIKVTIAVYKLWLAHRAKLPRSLIMSCSNR